MKMRVDALLSRYGYCSRREAAVMVRQGRVMTGGGCVRNPADKVDPARVFVDGAPVDFPEGLLVKLHKPAGYVCTHGSNEGPTIFDLLPEQWMRRKPLPAVAGRLDKDATGLVLITDDHQLVHRLITPKRTVPKIYRVELDRTPDDAVRAAFASGALVLNGEDRSCLPAQLDAVSERVCMVTLHEGRYHQIKRMFAACGFMVTALHRVSIGPWNLGTLPEGAWETGTQDGP